MENDHKWGLIFKSSIPIALIEAYLFYTNAGNLWKWLSLIAGMIAAGFIAHRSDRRKNNVFTSAGIVLLAALLVKFLRNLGFF